MHYATDEYRLRKRAGVPRGARGQLVDSSLRPLLLATRLSLPTSLLGPHPVVCTRLFHGRVGY
jgi:hypothetical protein